jgi:hypothetical protein
MAWRKPMVTVRDDPEALAAAACKKSAGRANCSRKWPSGGKEHATVGILRTRALRREAIAQLRWRAKQDELLHPGLVGVIYHWRCVVSRPNPPSAGGFKSKINAFTVSRST